jgi:hypothetical protein
MAMVGSGQGLIAAGVNPTSAPQQEGIKRPFKEITELSKKETTRPNG